MAAPGGFHERGHGVVLEPSDILDGEVDHEAGDPGEDADGEAEGPLEHHVPHLVAGPALGQCKRCDRTGPPELGASKN